MSWSFNGIGKPQALKTAIDADMQRYTGQSREEFEHAAPHIKGLLDAAHEDAAVSVNANGHASFTDGNRTSASVFVEIKQLGKIYA